MYNAWSGLTERFPNFINSLLVISHDIPVPVINIVLCKQISVTDMRAVINRQADSHHDVDDRDVVQGYVPVCQDAEEEQVNQDNAADYHERDDEVDGDGEDDDENG